MKAWAKPNLKRWKTQEAAGIPASTVESVIAPTEKRPTAKGGAPPRADRDNFIRELIRRLALDGGNISRTQFVKDMKQWADDNMNPPPDGRTVERWITHYVPPGVWPD